MIKFLITEICIWFTTYTILFLFWKSGSAIFLQAAGFSLSVRWLVATIVATVLTAWVTK